MYTPQIYSGTNVHANMPYCETRMKGLPTSIGVMCIHLPTTPFIYHPIHLPLAWRAHLLLVGDVLADEPRLLRIYDPEDDAAREGARGGEFK